MTNYETPDPWLRRVHALLAKAESTEFPSEAEALLAKAQELMSRHAIDEAMLRAARPGPSTIVTRTVVIDPPYAVPRSHLLGAVARANGCRMVVDGSVPTAHTCVLIGHGSDLDNVAVLFAALSLHATRTMLGAQDAQTGVRAFRHSFLLGFASRIAERLREAADIARGEAERSIGASVALVLRDRSAAVDEAVARQFPRLRMSRSRASSWTGVRSGRSAADSASLGAAHLQARRSLGWGR
jgi:hypothetical protein